MNLVMEYVHLSISSITEMSQLRVDEKILGDDSLLKTDMDRYSIIYD
ncbi:hypothetical protein [Sphingobacterium puteale]|nr:hypothetical protein [Sphingobacterium puteale]